MSTLFPYTTLFRSVDKSAKNVNLPAITSLVNSAVGIQRGRDNLSIQAIPFDQTAAKTAAAQTAAAAKAAQQQASQDRKSTRLNSSHVEISYAVFCLNSSPTPDVYPLSLHDALPICRQVGEERQPAGDHLAGQLRGRHPTRPGQPVDPGHPVRPDRSEDGGRADRRGGEGGAAAGVARSEEHTSELQSRRDLVCRLLLELIADSRCLPSFPTRRSSDLSTSRRRTSTCRRSPRWSTPRSASNAAGTTCRSRPSRSTRPQRRRRPRRPPRRRRRRSSRRRKIGRAHV